MKTPFFLVFIITTLFSRCATMYVQPEIEARKVQFITENDYRFKDLNKNGQLDAYEDWRLPVENRIRDLVSQMTLEEKAGLLFHPNFAVTPDGHVAYDLTDEERMELERISARGETATGQMNPTATAKSYIEEKNFRCILNNGVAEPETFARWSNSMQEFAEASRLGIPVMFSSDPRHGANLSAHVSGSQFFSQWPSREGQYGITATRNTDLVEQYGVVTAEEYRAVGLHMILGPQIDVTTEPRWRRSAGSFSESAELTAEMLEAYMDGAQGKTVGPGKILVMLKHWPGAGPHKGGTGDWLVYPGDNFDYHLMPWKAGIAKGALAAMGYYSGTYFDTLGVNFSSYISTEVLYNQLDFKGSICTDWYAISRKGALRNDLIGIPLNDRLEISLHAGVDQFGGETVPERIVDMVREGRISESRIDLAASRILQWHFKLGLFEDPYVDPEAAASIVRSKKNEELGYQAQLESIVMLSNDGTLPWAVNSDGAVSDDNLVSDDQPASNNNMISDERPALYILGIDSVAAAQYGQITNNPEQADLAILRVSSAADPSAVNDPDAGVNIEFSQRTLKTIREVSSTGVPVVVAVNLSRNLVVLPEELFSQAKATFMVFDVLDSALLEVVFGKYNPAGKLPFELPSSMDAVRKQLEDVPFDSEDPRFAFGFGLTYE